MTDETVLKPKEASRSKHRKWTCTGCRRRKVGFLQHNIIPTEAKREPKSKCDGRQPRCTTCIAYKDECHYDKPPSLAYVRSLEEEIAELKQQLRQARTQAWLAKVRACVYNGRTTLIRQDVGKRGQEAAVIAIAE
jgi:hypothetical protein